MKTAPRLFYCVSAGAGAAQGHGMGRAAQARGGAAQAITVPDPRRKRILPGGIEGSYPHGLTGNSKVKSTT